MSEANGNGRATKARAKGGREAEGTASGANGTAGAGHGQNGSELPISGVKLEDLANLTTEQLVAVANGHHQRFLGCMRKAVKQHARLAGAALVLLKSRLGRGNWGEWLEKHFKGSAGMARLYMRIAKNWTLIEQLALDREDVTLEDLRWVLSDSGGPRPGSKQAGPDLGVDDASKGAEDDGTGSGEAAAEGEKAGGAQDGPVCRPGGEGPVDGNKGKGRKGGNPGDKYTQLYLRLVVRGGDREERDDRVLRVMKYLGVSTKNDAFWGAMDKVYEEACREAREAVTVLDPLPA